MEKTIYTEGLKITIRVEKKDDEKTPLRLRFRDRVRLRKFVEDYTETRLENIERSLTLKIDELIKTLKQ